MSSVVKNIAVVLGLATIAFAGYYMYTTQGAAILTSSTDDVTLERMLAETRQFINYRTELDAIRIDQSIFEDVRFTELRSFTQPVFEQPVGRDNPFAVDRDASIVDTQPVELTP